VVLRVLQRPVGDLVFGFLREVCVGGAAVGELADVSAHRSTSGHPLKLGVPLSHHQSPWEAVGAPGADSARVRLLPANHAAGVSTHVASSTGVERRVHMEDCVSLTDRQLYLT
jgi:hypothetical protein